MMDSEQSEESMRYGILGSDGSTEIEKLRKYTGEIEWSFLEPHYRNGALLWVDPTLKLEEVGAAFADDDTERVADWRGNGDLVVPSTPHAFFWEESKARFRALVISPFVLIQPIE